MKARKRSGKNERQVAPVRITIGKQHFEVHGQKVYEMRVVMSRQLITVRDHVLADQVKGAIAKRAAEAAQHAENTARLSAPAEVTP